MACKNWSAYCICAIILICFCQSYGAETVVSFNSKTQGKMLPVGDSRDTTAWKHVTTHSDIVLGSSPFLLSFAPTIYIIIVSELGDKTFFISAIMSIQHSRASVYGGAMLALTTMTVLSALLGYATNVVPRQLTWFLSGFLFFIFGIKMLKDTYWMSPENSIDEYNEVQEDLRKRDLYLDATSDPALGDLPQPVTTSTSVKYQDTIVRSMEQLFLVCFNSVFAEAFLLTFLAEWGDRSQISTIILAATKNVFGVIVGGVLGHAVCTGLAVIAGRILALKIPIRWLTFLGGITFLLFSVHTFYQGPENLS